MAAGRPRFQTQAIPPAFFATASNANPAVNGCFSLETNADLVARRLSSLGCSTSSRSSSTSSAAVWRQLRRGSGRLPFASLSLHSREAGTTPGQQRSHLSSTSSSSGGGSSSAQAAQQGAAATEQPSMADMEAAAAAATAPDVFKQGDVLRGGRYQLLWKLGEGPAGLLEGLGEGRFATIWLGRDTASNSKVVLKLVEAGDAVSYTAGTREAALQAMAGRHPNIVSLLDAFEHRSSSGRHACMVLEPCGANLMTVASTYMANDVVPRGIESIRNTRVLKRIAKQLLQGLEHLHARGIAHMDLSDDNVVLDKPFQPLLQLTANSMWGHGIAGRLKFLADSLRVLLFDPEKAAQEFKEQLIRDQQAAAQASAFYTESTLPNATYKLLDFGRAVPFEQLKQQQGGPAAAAAAALSPRQEFNRDGVVVMGDPRYRPPEEVLGLSYLAPEYDIWRLGCLMYKLAVGSELFDTRVWARASKALGDNMLRSCYSHNDLHLFEMTNVLGDLPRELTRSSPLWSTFYTPQDYLRVSNHLAMPRGAGSVALPALVASQCDDWMDQAETQQFSEFLQLLLALDPAKRPKASDMLKHKWLRDAPESGAGD